MRAGARSGERRRVIYTLVLGNRVTVGHSGDVIGNPAGAPRACITLLELANSLARVGRQNTWVPDEHIEQRLNCPPRFARHPTDAEMPVIRDPRSSCYYRQEQKSGLIGVYETAHEHAEVCWDHRGGWPEWDSENELFEGDFEKSMTHLELALERVPIWAESEK